MRKVSCFQPNTYNYSVKLRIFHGFGSNPTIGPQKSIGWLAVLNFFEYYNKAKIGEDSLHHEKA